ncbi:MAG: hypothetical protein AAF215_01415 [Cyanobacteria bacterium P01_A01_bin.123]
MKRYLFSGLIVLLATVVTIPLANASQVGLQNLDADLNGDGQVTLTELKNYNRDQRQN